MSYTIFMRYNPEQPSKVSKYNKEMIEFLNKNIDAINGTGVELRLVLVDEDDNQMLKELSKKGISKVPALLGRNIKEPIQKIDKIKKFLLNNARTRKQIPKKGSDEELRDYQLDVMDPTGEEPDDDEYGDNNQRTAQINARLEFEKRRRDARNPRQNAGMTAADIIAQQKASRGRSLFGRRKPPAPKDDDSEGSDSDDDRPKKPKRRNRNRRERGNNMADNPAAIMAEERVRNQDEAVDKDLMTKFFEGRGVGTDD